jgi:hypothetical protein
MFDFIGIVGFAIAVIATILFIASKLIECKHKDLELIHSHTNGSLYECKNCGDIIIKIIKEI